MAGLPDSLIPWKLIRRHSLRLPALALHTVRIRFKPDREWQESINAAGPNTPSDYNVRSVGGEYPPTGTEEIEEDLILLNFPNSDGFDAALAWAKSKQLENTVPRKCSPSESNIPSFMRSSDRIRCMSQQQRNVPLGASAARAVSGGMTRGAGRAWAGSGNSTTPTVGLPSASQLSKLRTSVLLEPLSFVLRI